jgi:DNA-binding transcriptional LysR family regulator
MAPRYTIHQLEVFATVAERASFSRAAEALHLTQPTVSMQVKQLAEALGSRSLRRRPGAAASNAPASS